MSNDNVDLPDEWKEQGWTVETAAEEKAPSDEVWEAGAVVAAADPATLQSEGTEGEGEETSYG